MEEPTQQAGDLDTIEQRESGASQPVLARTRSLLPSLQASDARVAKVILEQPDAVIYRSVSEVAESAGTSSATVVRCAQKLGFRGFHDLKLALARERATFQAVQPQSEEAVDERIAVLAQVTSAGAQTVRDAAALVDPAAFEATVSALAAASRVLFAGVGTSAPLAQDAAYRFSAIGLRADAYADAHVQHFQALQLQAQDVCVAISHTGSTRETLEVAQAAHDSGARTVAITSFASSPLTELADQVIVAGTREVAFQLEAMASRLAHLALLDALLVAVAARDPDRAQAALLHFTDMLGAHRP
ncbi:MAG TPA: MurR/RpiR family transcriptional regulator [Solirubrobacteraceae bacterium]|jgi:DNA-binding MurR/RpiR family transcriptional regulator|nr:MurR/RpiR family transcriptional regulator [Solirubrobacteraceae bacterium]